MNPRKALERAKALHQQGNLADAERLYLSVLHQRAADVEALHGLGLLYARVGRLEEARRHLDRALGLDPMRPELHFHRAEVAGALGLPEQALDAYDRALALRPGYVDALVNMSDLLLQLGRTEEALARLEEALRARPDDMAALNNRGNALQALKRHQEALQCFERILVRHPAHPDVLNNRASALLSLGRFAEAESDCRGALAQRPKHAPALLNLGRAQGAQGRLAEACASFDAALALRPDDADAWRERGMALTGLRRAQEGLAAFERALELDPASWRSWNERGLACEQLGQLSDALRCFERAVALYPNSAMLLENRAETLRALGRTEEAREAFTTLLASDPARAYVPGKIAALSRQLCDWRPGPGDGTRVLAGVQAGKPEADPLDLLVLTDRADLQLQCARLYATDKYPVTPAAGAGVARARGARIRVAYLSADFRAHPTSHLLAGLIERHDRDRLEVFGISFGPEEHSEMARRMSAAFEHFVQARTLSDEQLLALMRERGIDIAVDLMGYTRFGRPGLFALRPSPVQVNYLGFPATTGSAALDYIIADAVTIPPGREPCYAEAVARLPDTFQANDALAPTAARPPARSALGLPDSAMVFCSFNNGAKIAPASFQEWMAILRAVERSVLWLWSGSPTMECNLRREAEARGVDGDRLRFAPWAPYPEHLARLSRADLALDTLPFNGGATTSDALRCGVPVLTCPGDAFAARMSGSLLHAIGMPELIAASLEEYKALAIRLGNDPQLLAQTKAKLARNRATHPLFDTDRLRRHIEAAYEIMWQRAQRGEPPASFSVPAVADAHAT